MPSNTDIDRGWAWLVLLASYVCLLMCSGLGFVAGMFQVVFLEQFQGSVAFTSWVTALFSSLMQLGGPLASVVSNCFNCRTSVMLGGAFMAVGLFISSMANSLEMLFVTFGIIAGIGLGLTYTAAIVVINFYFVEKRTLVTGIAFSASGLGIAITPQVSQLLFDNFSWRESLVIMSGAAAQICVFGALMSSVHESKDKSDSTRCCVPCTQGPKDQRLEQEYQINLEEDEALIQMCSFKASNEKKEIPKVMSEEACLIGSKGCEAGSCRDCTLVENCASHSATKELPSLPGATNDQQSYDVKVNSEFSPVHTGKKNAVPFIFFEKFISGSHKDFREAFLRSQSPASHRELTASPLPRIRALKNSTISRSHQELSSRLLGHPFTTSNPNLILRSNIARPGNLDFSRTSLHYPSKGSLGHLVVISRNPSVMGLVPSTSALDIIITPNQEFQNKDSPRSSYKNIFETSIIVGELSPLTNASDCEKGDNLSSSNNMESVVVTEQKSLPPLYRNKFFLILCLSLFVGNAGCGIFNIHYPSFMKKRGLSDAELTNILSVNGCAIIFGRCLCGALVNSLKGSDVLIFWALHVLGGLAICLVPVLGNSYASLVCLTYCIGSYAGTAYTVITVITIEMVGLTSLATAFGIEMVCAGLGYFVSPPLAGILVDLTNSYDHSMYSGGILFILGGMIILIVIVLNSSQNHMTLNDDTLKSQEKGSFHGNPDTDVPHQSSSCECSYE